MGGGGIFLAASVVHMLPSATGNQDLLNLGGCYDDGSGCENAMPWPYIFYGAGFLMILCLETFAHSAARLSSGRDRSPSDCEYASFIIKETSPLTKERAEEGPGALPVPGDGADLLSLVILLSLSFHSVMEGVAIGAQEGHAWNIFFAVVAHKALAASALGLELVRHRVPRGRFVFYVWFFSLMSPVGIFLGWLIVADAGANSSATGAICSALSGGTFLYVATMEILPKELRNRENQFLKVSVLCVSFFAFGALAKWV